MQLLPIISELFPSLIYIKKSILQTQYQLYRHSKLRQSIIYSRYMKNLLTKNIRIRGIL
jgi:hypothetical protein